MEFGFAGGQGGLSLELSPEGRGTGSVWVRDAQLGQWSLLGPLSIGTLKFNSAEGNFTLEPGSLKVNSLTLWGKQHAAEAKGTINTKSQTIDMTLKLKSMAGTKPTLGVFAPLIQPISSSFEAHLSGPLEKPSWNIQFASPLGL